MSGTKKYEIQFTKKQIFFTVTALISSFLLAFASGILIGNKFLGNKDSSHFTSPAQDTLVKPPSSDNKPLESLKKSPPEEEKNITKFTFYDTLPKQTELPLIKEMEKGKAKKQRISSTKRSSKKVKQFDQDIVRKGYTIQLGSFQQKEKAYALQNKLKKQGYLVHVTPKKIERGIWYRVRMGNFDTPEEAQEWVSKLGALSPPPFITSATD